MLTGEPPGWWPHFSFSLIERLDDLDAAPPFSLDSYLHAIARAWYVNATSQNWPWLAALLTGAWLLLFDRPLRRLRQADLLFAALLLSLVARCLLFPIADSRLYLPTILMLALLVAERAGSPGVEAQAQTTHSPSA
jgi:hypothetical protein